MVLLKKVILISFNFDFVEIRFKIFNLIIFNKDLIFLAECMLPQTSLKYNVLLIQIILNLFFFRTPKFAIIIENLKCVFFLNFNMTYHLIFYRFYGI